MRRQTLAVTMAFIALHPAGRTPDVSFTMIEYRVLAQVGQVRLTTGFVHDPTTQGTMLADLASFDRQGLILVAGDSTRQFHRRETIGSHVVETTISVYPAVGRGFRGGLATASLVVVVDGKKRIDCPYVLGETELADVEILPVDGMISMLGTHRNKPFSGLIFLTGAQSIDDAWLNQRAK